MVNQPKNWRLARCGDVIDVRDGTHDTPLYIQDGVPLITSKHLTKKGIDFSSAPFISFEDHEKIIKRSKVDKGDILFAMIGTIGNPIIVETDEEFSIKNVALFKFSKSDVFAKYFLYLLESSFIKDQLEKETRGGNQKFVSLGLLRNLKIPLPPLEEQKRIASVLDKADEVRAKRRAALEKLDSLLQSVFLDMFGDPVSNPKGWDERTIEELCFVKGGKRLPKGEDYSPIPTQFRYIRVTDLKKGMINESNLRFLTPEVQKTIKNYIVNEGDVVISIAGSIGLIAPIGKSLDGVNLTENAAKLVQKQKGSYNHIFMSHQLQMPSAQNQFFASIGQVTIGKLALFRIEKAKVLLPPKDLQDKFAASVSKIENLKDNIQLSTDESEKLFQSLQQRAFAGELFGANDLVKEANSKNLI